MFLSRQASTSQKQVSHFGNFFEFRFSLANGVQGFKREEQQIDAWCSQIWWGTFNSRFGFPKKTQNIHQTSRKWWPKCSHHTSHSLSKRVNDINFPFLLFCVSTYYLSCSTVPVTKTYYKDRKSGKEFLSYNMYLKKSVPGYDDEIPKNMDDYLQTELDELWLVNLIVNICQVVAAYLLMYLAVPNKNFL